MGSVGRRRGPWEEGLGLRALPRRPPSLGSSEALTSSCSSSGPGSTHTPPAAWRTWLRACAARHPLLSTCECWRTCCARPPGSASRSPCVGCAPTSVVNSALRPRLTYLWPSGLCFPGRRPPGPAPIPLLTQSFSRTRTPRPAAPYVRAHSRCDAPPGLRVWAGLGFRRLMTKLFIEGHPLAVLLPPL